MITVGTTDKVTSYDPAKGYSSADVEVMTSVYQGLLYTPPGGNKPVPQLAKSCSFSNPTTYQCTLRSGIKFSNGQPLTSADVKFSFDRELKINDPDSGSYLLAPLKSVDAPSPTTVTFNLKQPTATWPFVLSSPPALIVPKSYPADGIQADGKVIGSGPYKVAKYVASQQVTLVPNSNYSGPRPANRGITIIYYQTPSTMSTALRSGEIDSLIAWRSLAPTDLQGLQSDSKLSLIQVPGLDARFLDFNLKAAPVNNLAVRKAMAFLVDRGAIAKQVFNNTVEPLYSIVSQGVSGATKPFESLYGQAPDKAKAAAVLQAAHVKTPVSLTLWYTPSHYGSTSSDEYTEISRELNASGLFSVKVKSTEYEQYQNQINADAFQAFQTGWYPDYADADNFLAGMLGGGWKNNYSDKTGLGLIAKEEGDLSSSARTQELEQLQTLAAQQVAAIPIYQTNYTIVADKSITGIKQSLNPIFTIDFSQWK
ncbi:MAG: ABC transporter substrate-binding protein [bacterium]|nr:ABC transporter substrate-binding protein [bacterium]